MTHGPLSTSPRRPDETPTSTAEPGDVEPDLAAALAATGVSPRRARGEQARSLLAADGAVILPGLDTVPGSLALAAAEVAGDGLRQLFPVRHRGSDGDGDLALHADAFHVVHDVHGDLRAERDPDEDLLVMLLSRAPDSGGATVVVDGYAVVDALAARRPRLHEFLTGTEVDLLGAWRDLPGVPGPTRVGYGVEHTRRGRRIARLAGGTRPLMRSPRHAEDLDHLAELHAVAAVAAEVAPRTELEEGDALVLDNYRCWHGRDAFTGPRQLFVQTARTSAAY